MDEVVNAHEELKQQKLKVKEMEVEKTKAVEGLISAYSRFGCVRAGKKHMLTKRQRERSKQQQQQQSQPQQLTCIVTIRMTDIHLLNANGYLLAIKIIYIKNVRCMLAV